MSATRKRVGHHRGQSARLRARLYVQGLESRITPASYIVTSSADSGAGSLRAVIALSNANNEADTITFDPSVTTINLTTGQLTISEKHNLTIDGGDTVTINGAATASATNRIFNLVPAGQPTITFRGLTLAKGRTVGDGGAISCGFTSTAAELTLANCIISNNSVSGDGGALAITKGILLAMNCGLDGNSAGSGNSYPAISGGAIYANGNVTVTMNKCQVTNNVAPGTTSGGVGGGGGIYGGGGSHIALTDCSILNNTAPVAYGGGLEIYQSIITLTNCTVAGNSAGMIGSGGTGGLDLYGTSTATLTNCTIANNSSSYDVGGVWTNGPITIRNCTIVSNAGGYGAGGLSAYGVFPYPVIDSSIIANNSGSSFTQDIYASTIIGSNNLFGMVSNITIQGTNNPALIGSSNNRIDPGLQPLGDFGGPTLTMPPRYNSLAIDKGGNPLGLQFDQRGQPRELPSGMPDIGAVEGFAAVPFVAKVMLPAVFSAGGTTYSFSVTYDGPNSVDPSTLDGSDITIIGPHPMGMASLVGFTTAGNQVKATYQFTAPGGSWDYSDIGTYSVTLVGGQVSDLAQPSKSISAQSLGKFQVRIAGSFVVDAFGDQADGDYSFGKFTLREATQLAGKDSYTNDTITFDPFVFSSPKTIVLTSALPGVGACVINGPGAALLTISGNKANRILSGTTITLSGLTLRDGNAIGNGGAVAAGRLTTFDCVFKTNVASGLGGAISASTQMTLATSVFSGNAAASGGAVYGYALTYTSTVTDCVISGNQASAVGGGIYIGRGNVNIFGSTISGNSAISGGGICLKTYTNANMDNCTISSNSATSFGGAIYLKNSNSTLNLQHSTLTANAAGTNGGGLYRDTKAATATMYNTIIARNVSPIAPDLSFDAATEFAGNNNLIGVADVGNVTFTGTNNLLGTFAAPLNPLLAPLANYGGPTLTHALLPGSPAINAGSSIANLTIDQRGYTRTYGSAPDIGAYELQPPRVNSIIINDGSAQRSRVTELTVNFDSAVTLPAIPSQAFRLTRQSDGQDVRLIATVISGPTTSVRLRFNGELTDFGSLKDGRYSLTALGGAVSNFVSSLDGNGDAVPGDDYTLVGTPANGLFRLFGDSDGDGAAAANDLIQFRLSLGGTGVTFDFDYDGAVAASDFIQFRLRFGGSV